MEGRWDQQQAMLGSSQYVGYHHQSHYDQPKHQTAELPLPQAEQSIPALTVISPHFQNREPLHLLAVGVQRDFIFSSAHRTLLVIVIRSTASETLSVQVIW